MEFYKETSESLPTLVILRGDNAPVCCSGHDVGLWLNPETMRHSDAFVIHDPDGELHKRHREALTQNGYSTRVLNLTDVRLSARYNPFEYMAGTGGAEKLAAAIINGTKGLGEPGDIDFISCEATLCAALVSFLRDNALPEERRFTTLIVMLENMIQSDGEGNFQTAVYRLFEWAEESDPNQPSVRMFRKFKETAGESAQRVIASCAARLEPLKTDENLNFLLSDELALDRLFVTKTALFVIDGNADDDVRFLAMLMYSQLFDLLYARGE